MANTIGNARGVGSRAKLLEAGLKSFHEYGYAASGVDMISKSASVPKGSFYNHFGSKEAFSAEVVDLYFERYLESLRSSLANEALSPLGRLRAYFEDGISKMRSDGCRRGCLIGNFSSEVADHNELVRVRLAQSFELWRATIAECIRAAQDCGELPDGLDADAIADFLLNSWEGALLRMRAERSTAPLELFREIMFRTVLAQRSNSPTSPRKEHEA